MFPTLSPKLGGENGTEWRPKGNTALCRLAQIERSPGGDRAPNGTFVTKSDDGEPLSGAERKRLSLARVRLALLVAHWRCPPRHAPPAIAE